MLVLVPAALALLQETASEPGTALWPVLCAVGAVALIGIVILRRRSRKKQEDDF